MAMTKAEKAAMDALRVRCALAWPASPPKPVDLAVAKEALGGKPFRGWWYNRASRTVGEGISQGGFHARESYTDAEFENRYRGGSRVLSFLQGSGGPWYATKADALKALHYAVATDYAHLLAEIAARVEEADAE